MKLINVPLVAALATVSAVSSLDEKRQATACVSLTAPAVEDASITSLAAVENSGICEVYVYLTHTGASDNVSVITFLPINNWNGRFQGTGGGGFSTGGSATQLTTSAQSGWAVSTTDGGLPDDSNSTNFAFNPQLQKNFAYLSIHDMTVVGKALVEQFYGTPANNSYWNGCSTGGQQGYMEAQRYPADYSGIYAASPPLDYAHFQVSRLWPYVVQSVEGEFVPACVFDTLTSGAIQLCDIDDQGSDGLISNPPTCQANATIWVGYPATSCNDNGATVITETHAMIWNKIAYGPVDTNGDWLYFGIAKGASYSTLAGTTPQQDASGFTRGWVMNDTNFNVSAINYTTFPEIFNLAFQEQNSLIGTDNHDLTPFYQAGGKLLSILGIFEENGANLQCCSGTAGQIQTCYANETADYWTRVQETMGSTIDVHEFYRLFLAPGVGHCGGGYGAEPVDPFDVLISWVEDGTVPDILAASGNGLTRNLCLYPKELQYTGAGNISSAESWTCA
ncbi:putative Carboxylic ester hydrolase [Seiridium unicorne]|uniref:Carboxylic ester hydrolase n=1 Tax=Seiridium unicorne TaxID=138068 RepID=A0ABR2ULC6_9PEZI